MDPFYAVVRIIARFWIWFFFERVEVWHLERVPQTGPVLLCVNHPNNLIAHRYLVGTGRLRHQVRFGALLLTRAQEARRLLAERREIVEELEHTTRDYLGRQPDPRGARPLLDQSPIGGRGRPW